MASPVDKQAVVPATETGSLARAPTGIAGGILPVGATYAVVGASAALAAALLLATGAFTVGLMLLFTVPAACVALYAWSRTVEGPRRAKDRVVTLAIASAFVLAMLPLISLLYEVGKRGI